MPDISAVGGGQEADAGEHQPAESDCSAVAGPSATEGCEEEGHGKVHDAVLGRSDDTNGVAGTVECPVLFVVLLEDAIGHGET